MNQLATATCLLSVLAGCGGLEEFPCAKVTGTVTCKGIPVPKSAVFFEPLKSSGEGPSALVGKQGLGATNEKGAFVISTYHDNDGAVVGRHRVHVMPSDAPRFTCPCEFDSQSKPIEVEVKKGEKNDFKFELPVTNKRPELSLDQKEALQEAKQNTK
ncbi:MAG: hypothetical protein ABL921_25400 [Pirellula sp.]